LLTRTLANGHELRVHLLDQILIAAYPDPGERAHATYWLSWLAHKMSTAPHGPIRELRWWQIPSWIPRWQVGLAAGLVGGLVWGLALGLIAGSSAVGLMCGLVFGLVSGLVIGLMARVISPQTITIRRPTGRDLRGRV
jgi:hypothetical protein